MARYTGADCKRCRREKTKLFLKGAKCESPKCPIEIRPYPPGEHGRARTKESEYLLQMREKQKRARIYGVLEKQFRGYYEEANRTLRQDRREPAAHPRVAGWTTSSTAPGSPSPATPPASSCGTATSWSTATRSTSRQLPGQRERHRRGPRGSLELTPVHHGPRRRPASAPCRPGSRSSRTGCASSCTRSRAAGHRHPGPGAADRRALLEVSTRRPASRGRTGLGRRDSSDVI